MSHFTTIQTQIKDIPALRAACQEMDLTLLDQGTARGYADNRHPGDHIIQLKGPYDIAVVRQPEGHYQLVTDWWDGHVEREVGQNFGRLLQLYGVHKASREARLRGLTVQRKQHANGSIQLTIGKM